MSADIQARVRAAPHDTRVVCCGCFSDREETRTLTIRVPPCERGGTAYAIVQWKPTAPGPDDTTANRLLATQLKRLSGELKFRVITE